MVGASSEIGAALAVMLAGLGLTPVLIGRDEERLTRVAAACAVESGEGEPAVIRVADVRDRAALVDTMGAVAEAGTVAVAVWAAGVFDWAPVHRADPGRWGELLDTNLASAAVFAAAVAPALVAAAPSCLVFIGSGAAHQAFANNAAYVASKHGLAGLAGGTFLDLRDLGVKVSLVSPGLVAAGAGLLSPTGATEPERLLAPADVAAAVRFVVTFPGRGCPTVIRLEPQRTP